MEVDMSYNSSPPSPKTPTQAKAPSANRSPANGSHVISHIHTKKTGQLHASRKLHQHDSNGLMLTRPKLQKQEFKVKSPPLETNESAEAPLHPLKQLESIGARYIPVLKGFTLCVIVLPTLFSLVLPLAFPRWSADIDVANVFTDILMIIAIAFFVAFSVEWPWAWLQQIRDAKNAYLVSVSAFYLENLHLPMANLYEDRKFVNELTSILKLQRYQSFALCTSLGGICIGTILMVWSRVFVISDVSKKETIFNNFNITLFFLWGLFRSTLCVYDILQENTTRPKEQSLVLNEYRIHMLVSDVYDDERPLIETARMRYKFLIKMFTRDKLREVSELSDIYHFQSSLELAKGEIKELQSVMNQIVESSTQHQSTLKTLLERMDSNFKLLEQIQSEAVFQDPKTKLVSPKTSFVKPFPLNINLNHVNNLASSNGLQPALSVNGDHRLHRYGNALKPLPKSMTTIFEEAAHPISGTHSSPPTSEFEPVNKTNGHFSLHGLPFSSAIKELVTRKAADGQVMMHDQGDLLKSLDSYEGDNNTNFKQYSIGEPNTQNNGDTSKKSTYTSLILNSFDELVQKLSHISLRDTVMNPLAMSQIYSTDILHIVKNFVTNVHNRAAGHFEKVRHMMWEFFYSQVYQKQERLTKTAVHLHTKYVNGIKQIFDIFRTIFATIPYNVTRFLISVNLFLPRIFFRAFIVYPLMLLLEIMLDKSGDTSELSNPNFSSIKKFHLEPSKKRLPSPENRLTSFRTRTFMLNQLAKYFDIELKPDYKYYTYGDSTPVVLTGDV